MLVFIIKRPRKQTNQLEGNDESDQDGAIECCSINIDRLKMKLALKFELVLVRTSKQIELTGASCLFRPELSSFFLYQASGLSNRFEMLQEIELLGCATRRKTRRPSVTTRLAHKHSVLGPQDWTSIRTLANKGR